MKRWMLQRLIGLACALALVAVPVVAAGCGDTLGAEGPDASLLSVQQDGIAGVWQINRDESDPPPRGDGFGRMGGGPGGRGGTPGSGGRFGRPEGSGGHMGQRDGERGLLTIAVADDLVEVTHGQGRSETFVADGTRRTISSERGDMEITARWEDGALVVERSVPFGTLTETYALSSDATQLVIVRVVEGDRFEAPQEHRRVYDPVTDS